METTTPTGNVMMICPNLKCRKVLSVPEKYRGQQVKCHYCNITFAVPRAKPAATSNSSPPVVDDEGVK